MAGHHMRSAGAESLIMKVMTLQGNTFDLEELASTRINSPNVILTFRNGTQITLCWRDRSEQIAVFKALDIFEGRGGGENFL